MHKKCYINCTDPFLSKTRKVSPSDVRKRTATGVEALQNFRLESSL